MKHRLHYQAPSLGQAMFLELRTLQGTARQVAWLSKGDDTWRLPRTVPNRVQPIHVCAHGGMTTIKKPHRVVWRGLGGGSVFQDT